MIENKYIIQGDIIYHNKHYSSGEIKKLINKYIEIIIDEQLDKGNGIIGIAIERSPKLIAAILACIQCGITFFPMDLEIPSERMEYMLKHADIHNLFVSEDTKKMYENQYKTFLINAENEDTNVLIPKVIEQKSAYILYTSGTTGRPKAVEIGRKSLFNFIDGMNEIIEFKKETRIGCFTSCSFDIFFLESVLAMYSGLTVVLADENERSNPRRIIKMIAEHSIDMLQITPSKLNLLRAVDKKMDFLHSLNTIIIGGEQFPEKLLPLLQMNKKLKIYNVYGPTETTIWSMVADLTNARSVHLGSPIKNTEILLLDEELNEVKSGKEGSIFIGGEGVAKGYVKEENVNNNRFVHYKNKGRFYNTGDIGKYQNGLLCCLGRSDQQIKLNGNRIELDEIDYVISEIPKVEVAITCYLVEEQKLITFIKGNVDENEIKRYIEKKLPKYMLPYKYVQITEIVHSMSGKIDRKAMLEKYQPKEKKETKKIYDSVTQKIIKYFNEVTDEKIELEKKISDYSLDSIEYVTFVVSVEEEFMIEFEDEMLIDTDNIRLIDIVNLVKEELKIVDK